MIKFAGRLQLDKLSVWYSTALVSRYLHSSKKSLALYHSSFYENGHAAHAPNITFLLITAYAQNLYTPRTLPNCLKIIFSHFSKFESLDFQTLNLAQNVDLLQNAVLASKIYIIHYTWSMKSAQFHLLLHFH